MYKRKTEITEKTSLLSVLIKKQKIGKTIKCKIRFINSVKSMASCLLSPTDNLAEGLHKGKCKDCEVKP